MIRSPCLQTRCVFPGRRLCLRGVYCRAVALRAFSAGDGQKWNWTKRTKARRVALRVLVRALRLLGKGLRPMDICIRNRGGGGIHRLPLGVRGCRNLAMRERRGEWVFPWGVITLAINNFFSLDKITGFFITEFIFRRIYIGALVIDFYKRGFWQGTFLWFCYENNEIIPRDNKKYN